MKGKKGGERRQCGVGELPYAAIRVWPLAPAIESARVCGPPPFPTQIPGAPLVSLWPIGTLSTSEDGVPARASCPSGPCRPCPSRTIERPQMHGRRDARPSPRQLPARLGRPHGWIRVAPPSAAEPRGPVALSEPGARFLGGSC